MSSTKIQSALSSLPPNITALIASASSSLGPDANLHGKEGKDQDEVAAWVEKVAQGAILREESLQDLNVQLTPKTYVAANYLTAADISLYAGLHPTFAKLQPAQHYTYTSLTRYFNHIQNLKAIRSSQESQGFPLIEIDLQNAPPQTRNTEPVQKKKKQGASGAVAPADAAAAAVDASKGSAAAAAAKGGKAEGATEGKQGKKDKKKDAKDAGAEGAAAGGKKAKGGAAAAADDGPPKPSMIDLRVGKIVDIKRHPDADGLYVEQIDVGEETGPRTVISGLVNYIPIEKLQNKDVVVVANLKPANMRGIKSFAMLLCATHKDGKDAGLETVEPPAGSKPGERVYFEGEEYENASALSQLNPKKKIFETIQPGFTTLDSKEAAWINPDTKSVHRLRTKEGFVTTPSFVGASLS